MGPAKGLAELQQCQGALPFLLRPQLSEASLNAGGDDQVLGQFGSSVVQASF
jgi:hypothetical protein